MGAVGGGAPRTDSPVSPEAGSPRFDEFRPSATVVIQSERGEEIKARTLFDEASVQAMRAEEGAKSKQRQMFVAFCLLEIVANFDAGLLPAVEMHMSREYELAHTQAGLLGSLVYYGMVVGTPIAGYCLTNTVNQNVVVILGALLNSISIMMFALAPTQHFLYLGRFLMGASQGGIFVYAPVWVDEFSPESRQALWMATLQGSVVLGIVLGYIVGGAFVGYWQPWMCAITDTEGHKVTHEESDMHYQQAHLDECYNEHWKVGLYLQALCMGTFVLYYLGADATLVNSKGGERERLRWRTHALYRDAIVKLKPVNVDESVRRALGDGAQNSATTPSSTAEHMQKNLAAVLASFSPASKQDTGSDTHRYRKSTGSTAPAPGAGKRRTSVPDLMDIANMISHPQEGIGALVGMGEESVRSLGAGSMSGGGNVKSVQGIMDLFGHEDPSAGASGVGQLSLKEQLGMLWQSSLYIWLTLALCSLYYVVTGTQFWITEYANAQPPEGLGVDPTVVLWSFAFTSVTAPVIGVFLGGWVIDQQGGYKDEVYPTLRTCLYFAIGAAVSAVPAAQATDFKVVMGALWLILFFGGCIISPATGVCINAVHADLRSFSSAMSMFA
jgi:MFS family permease